MLIVFLSYTLTFLLTTLYLQLRRKRFTSIKNFSVKKNGITFVSTLRHRLKIDEAKVYQVSNLVYLRKENKLIVLKNVDKVEIIKSYLYFNGLGNVEILFKNEFYKYFNIIIKAEKFDFNSLKTKALYDILNNLFNLNKSIMLMKYITFITKILNISINDKGIVIKKNKYCLDYEIIYKINNRVKRIKVV